MCKIIVPTALRKFTGNEEVVEAEGTTVAELLASLGQRHPALLGNIADATGKLRTFVNFYVNEEDIRFLSGAQTQISPSDTITIVAAIAGG